MLFSIRIVYFCLLNEDVSSKEQPRQGDLHKRDM